MAVDRDTQAVRSGRHRGSEEVAAGSGGADAAQQPATRVPPRITPVFWIVKVLSTGMGEACSDYLAHRFGSIPAGAIGAVILLIPLVIQLRSGRYRPWVYWSTVSAVAVTGTMAADGLHIELKLPYAVTTVLYAVILSAILIGWYRSEHTLSIHSITTRRRELFYWATVMATFALGTAVGDLSAVTLHLGYFGSGLLFAAVIAVPALAHRFLNLNAVVAFWFAYVITRPLGASFADWLDMPRNVGGRGFGDGPVALVGVVLVAIGVTCVAALHKRSAQPANPTHVAVTELT
jgi:uncharacterized membrane-anchored protein